MGFSAIGRVECPDSGSVTPPHALCYSLSRKAASRWSVPRRLPLMGLAREDVTHSLCLCTRHWPDSDSGSPEPQVCWPETASTSSWRTWRLPLTYHWGLGRVTLAPGLWPRSRSCLQAAAAPGSGPRLEAAAALRPFDQGSTGNCQPPDQPQPAPLATSGSRILCPSWQAG